MVSRTRLNVTWYVQCLMLSCILEVSDSIRDQDAKFVTEFSRDLQQVMVAHCSTRRAHSELLLFSISVELILLGWSRIFPHFCETQLYIFSRKRDIIYKRIRIYFCCWVPVFGPVPTHFQPSMFYLPYYRRTPLIRINWDGEPSGYAENPDNWIFFNSLHWQFEV
jgi:hypothetical protein